MPRPALRLVPPMPPKNQEKTVPTSPPLSERELGELHESVMVFVEMYREECWKAGVRPKEFG